MSKPVALITGGGSGIGLAVAEHLVNFHGFKVAIADIVQERVEQEASRLGPDCLALHLDVADYDSQTRAFVQVFEWGGNRLDLFFANAGIGHNDSMYKDFALDESTGLPKPLDLRAVDVNLNAVLQGIHIARHFFLEKNAKPGGKIVVTSSSLGIYPNYTLPVYCATKHALTGLVRSLAPVYAVDHLTINSLHPALVDTNIFGPGNRARWPDDIFTPWAQFYKVFDMIVGDDKLTGQTIEISKEGLYFRQSPEHATPNMKEAVTTPLWEEVTTATNPRAPGENVVAGNEYQAPKAVC